MPNVGNADEFQRAQVYQVPGSFSRDHFTNGNYAGMDIGYRIARDGETPLINLNKLYPGQDLPGFVPAYQVGAGIALGQSTSGPYDHAWLNLDYNDPSDPFAAAALLSEMADNQTRTLSLKDFSAVDRYVAGTAAWADQRIAAALRSIEARYDQGWGIRQATPPDPLHPWQMR